MEKYRTQHDYVKNTRFLALNIKAYYDCFGFTCEALEYNFDMYMLSWLGAMSHKCR